MWIIYTLRICNIFMTDNKVNMAHTNISINVKTKKRLDTLGTYKDSYDKIINRLIDSYEKAQSNS